MEPAIRVLLVDSDAGRRAKTAESLRAASDRIHLVTAGSVASGVDQVAERTLDCVVAAFSLSDGDGLALFETIRETEQSLPFVLLTTQPDVQREAFAAGVTDVVPLVEDASSALADRIESHTETRRVASTDETARRQYQAFIDNVPGIVYRRQLDADGVFESVSGRCETVSGYTREQLETGVRWATEVIHPDDYDETREQITAALDAGERFELTYRVRTADGETRWVQDRGWEVDTTDRIVEGLITDVTEQKNRERDLHREHERFLDLFSNFPEPTVAYGLEDGETVFQRVNTAFEDLFGYAEDEILGESVNELLVPEEQRDESERIDQQVETGAMVDRVVRRLAADGARIFNLRSIPVTTGGDVDGFAVYRDITERKHRERELRRKNERLEEFASIVSHDLRNPLNVAMGHLDLARQECDTPAIDNVGDALDRMEVLIHETLQLAKQGEMVTEPEPLDLADLVEGCWEMVDNREATVQFDDDMQVYGDRSRVKQLFENLFRNAIEHGRSDVTIRVGLTDDVLFIEDDGPGIPEAERDRVFETGHTTSEDGTGFGLAIVAEIAEAHDWDISVTEGSMGGARFEITGLDGVD